LINQGKLFKNSTRGILGFLRAYLGWSKDLITLNQAVFLEAAGAVLKIGSNLKLNNHH